ncbi:MAG: VOC family protein [Crocinitomicaceae bacterium]|nr:VOC family protein [Crocinitomicaceae bacterium]
MKLRYARHTNNLVSLVQFYTKIIGLEVIGEFKDHDGYDGVFLGIIGKDWHLEFTSSNEKVLHQSDPDDLIVFYLKNEEELKEKKEKAIENGLLPQHSKNPYWNKRGVELKDPDGFGVILTLSN